MENARLPRSLRLVPAVATLVAFPSLLRADLESYVKSPDSSYGWKVEKEVALPGGKGSAILTRLTSQTWRGIEWKHWLTILCPAEVSHPDSALLLIAGGSNRDEMPRSLPREAAVLARIARETGSVVAAVSQVPNQPLFEKLYEDALIAYTFEQFLRTKDATWPCLLPMTKSAVKAMDAVQEVIREKHAQEIRQFVVTGASKRGWTTWLTGAVDPRVQAIAPMVIDVLNMREQMPLQVKSFGGYSEKIHDYSDRNLPDRLQEPIADRLLELVDPYSYREKLDMPKLILLGTNDRYWPVDAVKLYFPGLKGAKHIHYTPNKGHGLGAEAVTAVAAFYHAVLEDRSLPRFEWKLTKSEKQAKLTVHPKDRPLKVELWQSSAPTRDFRDSRWTSTLLEPEDDGRCLAALPLPEEGFVALFGRLTYTSGLGVEFTLSTNVEVLGD